MRFLNRMFVVSAPEICNDRNETSVAASIGIAESSEKGHVVTYGWGFDSDEPLRPWPTLNRHVDYRMQSKIYLDGWTFALCGFFISFRRFWTI